MDLLRLATAGCVDDGKSTLIGRLLYDAKAVLADQLAHVEERSVNGLDLALLTDGLRAEREQGITIDVAYRSFATPKRRFILADCPGHAQYTRNMVTGASTADLALLLVDARAGPDRAVAPARHDRRAAADPPRDRGRQQDGPGRLRRGALRRGRAQVLELGAAVGLHEVEFIPISALNGDNVVDAPRTCPGTRGRRCWTAWRRSRSSRRPSTARGCRSSSCCAARAATRWAAGRLAAGALKAGDEVVVLPSGTRTRVAEVRDADGTAEQVEAPLSVSIRLEDEVDLARGELIAAVEDAPEPTRELHATLCWLGDRPARERDRFLLKHGTRTVPARLDAHLRADRVRDARVAGGRGAAPQRHRARVAAARRRDRAPTPTSSATPPARSSSSTRRRTTPWPRAWSPRRSIE